MTDLAECAGCQQLGICCYFPVELPMGHVYSSLACPFLNDEKGLCVIYNKRAQLAPWCWNPRDNGIQTPSYCPHHKRAGKRIYTQEEFFAQFGHHPDNKEEFALFITRIDDMARAMVKQRFGLEL